MKSYINDRQSDIHNKNLTQESYFYSETALSNETLKVGYGTNEILFLTTK